jgi:beta-lactamase superfamily II metal-dependent hydrolase
MLRLFLKVKEIHMRVRPNKSYLALSYTPLLALLASVATMVRAEDAIHKEIEPWQPGTLDIHQISTGRGNSGLYIFPDGTTLLVDAGEIERKTPNHTPDRPDGSRPAGAWLVRYIRHALRHDPKPALDYALLTHFHEDHMGGVTNSQPMSPSGAYRLTGITWVGEKLRMGKLLDRGWPDYNYPMPLESPVIKNYRAFVKWQADNHGVKPERFIPGRNDQVVLCREPNKYPQFEFQNIGANGVIWTGKGTTIEHRIPSLDGLPRKQLPDENVYSISFRLRYGSFRFFNGGDQPGIRPNKPAWYDIETPVAKVVGPVDAAILDHHGYVDTMNEFFVSTLRARVWTISVWDTHHPTEGVWERLFSEKLYSGPRDVFATDVHPKAREAIKDLDRMASGHGHIVIRVAPGGTHFRVVMVDDTSESHRITKIFGPFESKN